jgi:hypothetical protein
LPGWIRAYPNRFGIDEPARSYEVCCSPPTRFVTTEEGYSSRAYLGLIADVGKAASMWRIKSLSAIGAGPPSTPTAASSPPPETPSPSASKTPPPARSPRSANPSSPPPSAPPRPPASPPATPASAPPCSPRAARPASASTTPGTSSPWSPATATSPPTTSTSSQGGDLPRPGLALRARRGLRGAGAGDVRRRAMSIGLRRGRLRCRFRSASRSARAHLRDRLRREHPHCPPGERRFVSRLDRRRARAGRRST